MSLSKAANDRISTPLNIEDRSAANWARYCQRALRRLLLLAAGNFLFWEPAHWIMQTRRFVNLKRRAEQDPTN